MSRSPKQNAPENQTANKHDQLTRDLRERVKELSVLHKVANLLLQDRPLDQEFLTDFLAIVTPGWQYPEACEARIRYGETEVRTPGWKPSPWVLTTPLKSESDTHGLIEVIYTEERPEAENGPFLSGRRRIRHPARPQL